MQQPKGVNLFDEASDLEDNYAQETFNTRTFDEKEGLLGPRRGFQEAILLPSPLGGIIPFDIPGKNAGYIVADNEGRWHFKEGYPNQQYFNHPRNNISTTGSVTLAGVAAAGAQQEAQVNFDSAPNQSNVGAWRSRHLNTDPDLEDDLTLPGSSITGGFEISGFSGSANFQLHLGLVVDGVSDYHLRMDFVDLPNGNYYLPTNIGLVANMMQEGEVSGQALKLVTNNALSAGETIAYSARAVG